jgi:GNAT superfamily N-acetyltransferase
MTFYENGPLIIRTLAEEDIVPLADAFLAQGWNDRRNVLGEYLREQEAGTRHALTAVWDGRPVGYVTLLLDVKTGTFAGTGIPEIRDFNVLMAFQRRGIGNALMDVVEEIARKEHPVVGLGVGMHAGYGSAQRMYVKRGYIPDGTGIWYNDAPLEKYAPCVNDDDLVLYMMKELA